MGITLKPAERAGLRKFLEQHFGLEELRTLAFDLGIDFEPPPSYGLSELSRDLIAYCERRDMVGPLITEVLRQRPDHELTRLLTRLIAQEPHSGTLTPPPEIGDIYAVINKEKGKAILVGVKWGAWNQSEKIDLSHYDGLVLHLKHLQEDSWPLSVTTEGRIVNGPYQGEPPSEWRSAKYLRVDW